MIIISTQKRYTSNFPMLLFSNLNTSTFFANHSKNWLELINFAHKNEIRLYMKFNIKHIVSNIALAAIVFLPISGHAQDASDKHKYFPKLFKLNESFSIGIQGAGLEHMDYGAMGLNATFYGFYLDYMWWPRKHDNDVRVDKWQDHSVWGSHVGYQIPFFQYAGSSIRLIPMVGYTSIKEGITDGEDWSVGESGIVNKFHVTEEKGGFDYGAALVFQNSDSNIGAYDFSIGVTRHTLWVGLAWEFQIWKMKQVSSKRQIKQHNL